MSVELCKSSIVYLDFRRRVAHCDGGWRLGILNKVNMSFKWATTGTIPRANISVWLANEGACVNIKRLWKSCTRYYYILVYIHTPATNERIEFKWGQTRFVNKMRVVSSTKSHSITASRLITSKTNLINWPI